MSRKILKFALKEASESEHRVELLGGVRYANFG